MKENYVQKQQFVGLKAGENGQVSLTTEVVDESKLITAQPDDKGAHSNGGGEEQKQLLGQLQAVTALADGLEEGVLNSVQGDGPAQRLHQVLSGIQSNMQTLADSRDDALAKAADLQKQVDDLKAQADKARQGESEAKEIAELKAKLDSAKVTYRANASKESLQKQVDDLPKA